MSRMKKLSRERKQPLNHNIDELRYIAEGTLKENSQNALDFLELAIDTEISLKECIWSINDVAECVDALSERAGTDSNSDDVIGLIASDVRVALDAIYAAKKRIYIACQHIADHGV